MAETGAHLAHGLIDLIIENNQEKKRKKEENGKIRRIHTVLGLIIYSIDMRTLSFHKIKGKMQKTSSLCNIYIITVDFFKSDL